MYIFLQVVFMLMKKRMELQTAGTAQGAATTGRAMFTLTQWKPTRLPLGPPAWERGKVVSWHLCLHTSLCLLTPFSP